MFDIDRFIADCQVARADSEPRGAVRQLMLRTCDRPHEVAEALSPTEGGITILYQSEDLTIIDVVWAPHMSIYPHDHLMWAVIGIYAGQEDNSFFRRCGPQHRDLTESGRKEVAERDVLVLGDDTIHSVSNPKDRLTAGIHVYGGDFVHTPRSQWGPGPRQERPFDIEDTRRQFFEANAAWRSQTPPVWPS
jgi:predicted metal-dependent enzyme (double-stranded beta helix superfamily)